MTDLEIQLRAAMDDLAADAPAADGLLDTVRRRGRTVHRRRVVAGIAAAVVVAVVGGLSLSTLTGDDDAVQRVRVATPGPSESADAPVRVRSRPVPSPVDVGWLPQGFPEPTVRNLGPRAWALDTRRDEGMAALQVQVMAERPAVRTSPGELSDVDVDGFPGRLYWVPTHAAGAPEWGHTPPEAEGPYAELTFPRLPGQWIRIIVQNSAGDVDLGITKADLVRIAAGLTDEPRAAPDAIRVGGVPDTMLWGTLSNDDYRVSAGFLRADTPAEPVSQEEQPNGHNGSVAAPLTVSVYPVDSPELSMFLATRDDREPNLSPGEFGVKRQNGTTMVFTALRSDPKLAVLVEAKDSLKLSEAALRVIAENTALGPDAAVKPSR